MSLTPSPSGHRASGRRWDCWYSLIPRAALRHLATQLLVVAQWRALPTSAPSDALLRACVGELLRTAQPQYGRTLVQALLAGADTLPISAQVPALEALAFAVLDGALQRRTRQFSNDAPALSRVVFECDFEARKRPLDRHRIVRLSLFNTHQQALIIGDRQLDGLLTRPSSEHRALLERVRSFTGARLPDLESLESWMDALLTLCFAHYDFTGHERLSLHEEPEQPRR